jgi:Cytochrome P460
MVAARAGQKEQLVRPSVFFSLFALVTLAGVAAYVVPASAEATALFVKKIPARYRDWRFVSVAREEAPQDDIRVILGNDAAIEAYRQAKRRFPDGTILARLAYGYQASEENNEAFGRRQSFVAGRPKNGVQFMIKDSKKYAATGGWGYGQFNDGKAVDDALLTPCYPCHQAVKARLRLHALRTLSARFVRLQA